jgi:putative transferase (TIGR04331 family)
MSILLVTTAVKKTRKNNKNLLFLGEWCKEYSDEKLLNNIKHKTIDYHWNDREKFKSDYKYLKDINEYNQRKV